MFGNLLSGSSSSRSSKKNNAQYGNLSQKWEEQRKKWKSTNDDQYKVPAVTSADDVNVEYKDNQEQGTTDNDSFSLSDLDWDEVIDYLFSDRWRYHESLPVAVPLGQMVDILVDHWTEGI